eukprot:TRINITY_DN7472_c0_g1_i1.p1 TRINITY_DN7472_c0_g1~~TRINITY_DN7472_c0_g1_i1.p1  ORF type:complete len:665 (-),score=122.27 TRINITY_DN7472_c0_g1_i1:271-2265(-)
MADDLPAKEHMDDPSWDIPMEPPPPPMGPLLKIPDSIAPFAGDLLLSGGAGSPTNGKPKVTLDCLDTPERLSTAYSSPQILIAIQQQLQEVLKGQRLLHDEVKAMHPHHRHHGRLKTQGSHGHPKYSMDGQHQTTPTGAHHAESSANSSHGLSATASPIVSSAMHFVEDLLHLNTATEDTQSAKKQFEERRSRSSFDALRTEDQEKSLLKDLFLCAEDIKESVHIRKPPLERIRSMSKRDVELIVDSWIGVVIVVNAIFIGFSLDAPPDKERLILGIDVFLSSAFIVELIVKLLVHGVRRHFCGHMRLMNLLDAFLILSDLLQLVMQLAFPDQQEQLASIPSASLFRLFRLARLVRVLRLLRFRAFHTLFMMMQGMLGGLPTLGWALLLCMIFVYMAALMFREAFGREHNENIHEYFKDVPRAMITTFRCSFLECDTIQGAPIFQYVGEEYGYWAMGVYTLFAFSMSMGLFNVISAIFVESTLNAASKMKYREKKARLQDDDLWATRIDTIVKQMVQIDGKHDVDPTQRMSEMIDDLYDLDVTRETMDDIGRDPLVQKALADLDVEPEIHDCLSDVLDPDQGGSIAVIELVQGIKRLRGDPRRSDLVMVDLMCRSMQQTIQEVHQMLSNGVGNGEVGTGMSLSLSPHASVRQHGKFQMAATPTM